MDRLGGGKLRLHRFENADGSDHSALVIAQG